MFCNEMMSTLKGRFRSICTSENSYQHPISSAEGPLKSYITVTQKSKVHASLERFLYLYYVLNSNETVSDLKKIQLSDI